MTHIGHKIEEVLRKKRIPVVEFARDLNTTRNNIYNIFSRESIDTNLLEKIETILDYNFFEYLSKRSIGENNFSSFSHKEQLAMENLPTHPVAKSERRKYEEKIRMLEKEVEQLKYRLADKEEIIILLKKDEITTILE